VFWLNPLTGVKKVLHSFNATSDGGNPAASLIYVGIMLYGTTSQGGSGSCALDGITVGCAVVFFTRP
jgi:hypothetical protein